MIFYDWNTLRKHNIKEILTTLYYLTLSTKQSKTPIPTTYRNILGRFGICDSFLLKPENLSKLDLNHTEGEVFQYLHMASLRSYEYYKNTGDSRLPLHFINASKNIIKYSLNSSFIIDEDCIIFKYEE